MNKQEKREYLKKDEMVISPEEWNLIRKRIDENESSTQKPAKYIGSEYWRRKQKEWHDKLTFLWFVTKFLYHGWRFVRTKRAFDKQLEVFGGYERSAMANVKKPYELFGMLKRITKNGYTPTTNMMYPFPIPRNVSVEYNYTNTEPQNEETNPGVVEEERKKAIERINAKRDVVLSSLKNAQEEYFSPDIHIPERLDIAVKERVAPDLINEIDLAKSVSKSLRRGRKPSKKPKPKRGKKP